MVRINKCYWYSILSRALWRDVCSQVYCFRVWHVDFRRIRIYLIKEFQRFKEKEYKQLGWDIRKNLTKSYYRIQTNAIKLNLVPQMI